MHLLKAVNTS